MNRPNESATEEACCRCPFCDESMEMPFPFCKACGAEIKRCPVCGHVLPEGSDTCPNCAEQRRG